MDVYCTLFDKNYMGRGIAMYESLSKFETNFKLYIFSFDDISYKFLKELDLENVILISLQEFENEKLLSIKNSRSKVEYMWTCTPHIMKYVMENSNCDSVTYLDADIYFFQPPSILLNELKDAGNSILITEHRYTPERDQSARMGKYCVQFVTFKRDEYGLEAMNWWAERCLEWCYARVEDGKFGDQKYLDDWTTRFNKVHELQHLGGGVAPWNVQQYDIYSENDKVKGRVRLSNEEFELVFYHFHRMRMYTNGKIDLIYSYPLTKSIKLLIYDRYISHLFEIEKRLKPIIGDVDINNRSEQPTSWKLPLTNIRRRMKGIYNLVQY